VRKAIVPGSFDPVTNGHLDVIERAAAQFDEVIVAILTNPRKQPLFSAEERLAMLEDSLRHLPNVRPLHATGLLVDLARQEGARAIVKGLRPIQDFEYEWQMGMVNRELDASVETFFLMSGKEYSYLSSSIVRELAAHQAKLTGLVPDGVVKRLREKFGPERI
jgi:pantetheine-phosphate adenylyltransferase